MKTLTDVLISYWKCLNSSLFEITTETAIFERHSRLILKWNVSQSMRMGSDLLSVLGALKVVFIGSKASKLLHDFQLSPSLSTYGSTYISNHAHQLGVAGSPNLLFIGDCAREQFWCLTPQAQLSVEQTFFPFGLKWKPLLWRHVMISVKSSSPKVKSMNSSFIKNMNIFDIFYHFPQFEHNKSEVWKGKNLCAWGVKIGNSYLDNVRGGEPQLWVLPVAIIFPIKENKTCTVVCPGLFWKFRMNITLLMGHESWLYMDPQSGYFIFSKAPTTNKTFENCIILKIFILLQP